MSQAASRSPLDTLVDPSEQSSIVPARASGPVLRSRIPDAFVFDAPQPLPALLAAMAHLLASAQWHDALKLAELVLEREPENAEAKDCLLCCQIELEQAARAQLGSLAQVPRLMIGPDQLRERRLDCHACALVELIDGASTLDSIAAASAMPAFQALGTLAQLARRGIIAMTRVRVVHRTDPRRGRRR
jgi:hypothetical protein